MTTTLNTTSSFKENSFFSIEVDENIHRAALKYFNLQRETRLKIYEERENFIPQFLRDQNPNPKTEILLQLIQYIINNYKDNYSSVALTLTDILASDDQKLSYAKEFIQRIIIDITPKTLNRFVSVLKAIE